MKTQIKKMSTEQIKELAQDTLVEKDMFINKLKECIKVCQGKDKKIMESHLRKHIKQCDHILEGIILELCERL